MPDAGRDLANLFSEMHDMATMLGIPDDIWVYIIMANVLVLALKAQTTLATILLQSRQTPQNLQSSLISQLVTSYCMLAIPPAGLLALGYTWYCIYTTEPNHPAD